jgi:uncharacterized protein with GYD domain
MALYMFQSTYTAESVAALIREPEDRIESVRPGLEAAGAKIVAGGFPFGEHEIVLLIEVPDGITAASLGLVGTATGAFSKVKITQLVSGQEWVESLRKAQDHQYRPPRAIPAE